MVRTAAAASLLLAVTVAAALAAGMYGARAGAGELTVFASAGGLRNWCQARGAPRAACRGYLMGVVDILRHPGVRGSLRGCDGTLAPCVPDQLKAEQVRHIFLAHLHANPDAAGLAAADQIWLALRAAFACPRRRPPDPARPGGDAERVS